MAKWKHYLEIYRILPSSPYSIKIKREKLDRIALPDDWANKGSWFFLKKWAEDNNYRVERLSTDFIGERVQ